jgi:hypothetical protein
VHATPVNGRKISSMVMVSRLGQTVLATKASTSKAKSTDVAASPGLTTALTRATSLKTT